MKTLIITTNVARRLQYGEELEQRVIMTADGHVYFTAISIEEGQEVLKRKEEITVAKQDANALIDETVKQFAGEQWSMMPRLGTFNVVYIKEDGQVENFYGSMTGVHSDLTKRFLNVLNIKDLYLFG